MSSTPQELLDYCKVVNHSSVGDSLGYKFLTKVYKRVIREIQNADL